MLQKIKNTLWYVVEFIVFVIILSCVHGYYSRELNTTEQNLKAAQGEIVKMELKNGELLVAKDSYIATIDNLENVLKITKKEAKDLQRQLDSKIAYISKIETNTKVEYIEVVKDSIVYVNNDPYNIVAAFHYTDKWLNIKGISNICWGENFIYNTTLNEIKMDTPLTVGLTEDYKIFVTSPNPYVNFSNINGAVIDKNKLYPSKKKFNWGLQGGMGIMYDITRNNISAGPYIGAGVEWNF